MVSQLFLGLSLVGAEWVLWFMILLSIYSFAIIIERFRYYHQSTRNAGQFRLELREAVLNEKWDEAVSLAKSRTESIPGDMDSAMALAILENSSAKGEFHAEALSEAASDSLTRIKIFWDKNLVMLAIIGSNAPFIGLFGTVLGIITAFHQLSSEGGSGVTTVMAGIAEALVATAVGLFVAIPAVVAFNLFQRKVKTVMAQAEALKSFLIGRLALRRH